MNKQMDKQIWHSDSMEPAIEFGDEIQVFSAGGRIQSDGVYLFLLEREKIQPHVYQKLCAPVVQVIWRVARLDDGRIALTCDNPGYHAMNAVVSEAELLSRWGVAGRVSVVQRHRRGFRVVQSSPQDIEQMGVRT